MRDSFGCSSVLFAVLFTALGHSERHLNRTSSPFGDLGKRALASI